MYDKICEGMDKCSEEFISMIMDDYEERFKRNS